MDLTLGGEHLAVVGNAFFGLGLLRTGLDGWQGRFTSCIVMYPRILPQNRPNCDGCLREGVPLKSVDFTHFQNLTLRYPTFGAASVPDLVRGAAGAVREAGGW